MIKIKHICCGFYRLTAPQAKLLTIDGELPKEGWEKRARPAAELNKMVVRLFWNWRTTFPTWQPTDRPIGAGDHCWISRTPLSWHDGETVPDGWVWALHVYEVGIPWHEEQRLNALQAERRRKLLAETYVTS